MSNNECIVTCNFSENYAFTYQDAIQGVHWNNDQATIHPIVLYYKEGLKEIHKNFVAISDCLKHDTVAVHQFQRKFISRIKDIVPDVEKLYYFTDGAPQQYKNKKNFINITHHSEDFGVHAEWHFFATAHGKGACDGIGGTIKRLARRACIQNPNILIKTPKQLFEWANENVDGIECLYFDTNGYKEEKQ